MENYTVKLVFFFPKSVEPPFSCMVSLASSEGLEVNLLVGNSSEKIFFFF